MKLRIVLTSDLGSKGGDIGTFWVRKPINIFLYKQMWLRAYCKLPLFRLHQVSYRPGS